MSNPRPTVSIIIPTLNRLDELALPLRSVALQSYSDYEVIVVDDGSSKQVLDEYERLWKTLDDRFILERSVVPGIPPTRQSASRNRGIHQSRGEFLAFSDDDDQWTSTDHLFQFLT